MIVARSDAWPWVKLPVIWTGPLNDEDWKAGLDCTTPSRTIATSLRGDCWLNEAAARVLNFASPELFRFISTA